MDVSEKPHTIALFAVTYPLNGPTITVRGSLRWTCRWPERDLRRALLLLVALAVHAACAGAPSLPEVRGGLSRGLMEELAGAESFQIFAIHPFSNLPDDPDRYEFSERVGVYGILGKAEVSSRDDRLALLQGLYKAMLPHAGTSGCYFPRHALRVATPTFVWEAEVCFECMEARTRTSGRFSSNELAFEPRSFQRVFAAHGLKIHDEHYVDWENRRVREILNQKK